MTEINKQLYLKELYLKNFAIFADQRISFCKTFNAIVGETGSGKSLILDAFQLTLGHRAHKYLLRKDAPFAIVEAVFGDGQQAKDFFEHKGIPLESGDIVIKRIIYPHKSKSYINDQSCSIQVLAEFAMKFVDLVGQFDNQKLLNSEYQLKLIDFYDNLTPWVAKYKQCFTEYTNAQQSLDLLQKKHSAFKQKKELLEFQRDELQKLNPTGQDETELIEQKNNWLKQKQMIEVINNIQLILSEQDNSILALLKKIEKMMTDLPIIDESNLKNQLNESLSILEEVSYSLAGTTNNIEHTDQRELDIIVNRLDKYQQVKRKFDCSANELRDKLDTISKELQESDQLESQVSQAEHLVLDKERECYDLANELHKKREVAAKLLSHKLTNTINNLAMDDANIVIKINKRKTLGQEGISMVSFTAETNRGEGFYPIKQIASGGELSRILLAIRQLANNGHSVSIFFFDEIDTGIGGATAHKIGKTLQEIGRNGQVLAITHLPQIAQKADRLIVVSKDTVEGDNNRRTKSTVRFVDRGDNTDIINDMAAL